MSLQSMSQQAQHSHPVKQVPLIHLDFLRMRCGLQFSYTIWAQREWHLAENLGNHHNRLSGGRLASSLPQSVTHPYDLTRTQSSILHEFHTHPKKKTHNAFDISNSSRKSSPNSFCDTQSKTCISAARNYLHPCRAANPFLGRKCSKTGGIGRSPDCLRLSTDNRAL